jgi:hypothetical protein
MSASSTLIRWPSPAAETFDAARSRINGAMSAATTSAPCSLTSLMAVVPTPDPTSSTRSPALISAQASSRSGDARPPGWMTVFPKTAKKAYGSRALTSSVVRVGISYSHP